MTTVEIMDEAEQMIADGATPPQLCELIAELAKQVEVLEFNAKPNRKQHPMNNEDLCEITQQEMIDALEKMLSVARNAGLSSRFGIKFDATFPTTTHPDPTREGDMQTGPLGNLITHAIISMNTRSHKASIAAD